MNIYKKENAREKIRKVLDSSYERLYPYEIEKELGAIIEEAEENKDEEIKQEILWEIDLLNRTFGHKGDYKGKKVEEISNKWEYYLENKEFTKRFSKIPFCEWKEEAVDYYKKRYEKTSSQLSKARYSFAIMIFSNKERIEWIKKSVDGWLKTAEKYIGDEVYNKEYYDVPRLSYEFALKLSFSFNQEKLKKEVLTSLHKNIIKIITSGEKRWYLEYLEVEAKYINRIKGFGKEKKESISKIKERIKEIGKEANPSFHFLRNHVRILISYGVEDLFYWNKKIADSYIGEAERREEFSVKSSFFNSSIKHYKLMQGKSPNPSQKKEIDEKINELTSKIKETSKKTKYKEFSSVVTIKNDDIKKIVKSFGDKDIFYNLLDENSLIPNYQHTIKKTEDIRKRNPLGFIIPNVISRKDALIIKHSSEEQIFDFKARQNILIGIKISSVMVQMILEEIKKECKIDSLEEAKKLILETAEIEDIKKILDRGISYILGEPKDFIAGIHIVVPYFEELIRRILVKAGKKDLVLKTEKTKYFRVIELGTLLIDEEVRKIIGEDFQKTLKVLLVDNDQLNLRQDLAHGILTTDRINEGDTLYAAYCLLRLILILNNIKTKNS